MPKTLGESGDQVFLRPYQCCLIHYEGGGHGIIV